MEKSGSADLLITTTHRQGSISRRYGHIHTVRLWQSEARDSCLTAQSDRQRFYMKESFRQTSKKPWHHF